MSRPALLLAWGALAALAHALPGWLPGGPARADLPEVSPRTVHYRIEASLDPATHVVSATGELVWRNDAEVAVPHLRFHLYLNAFRDLESTFMRESGGTHRRRAFAEDQPGGIEIRRLVRLGEGAGEDDLLPGATFVAPDDGNAEDRTVLDVPLAAPIPPGESIRLGLAWESRLPKVFARTGFGGPFHMVAQWYPKLGVFETDPRGGGEPCWNCHQFHGTSEFFADYGVYDVRVTLPRVYAGKVGGTGRIVEETLDEEAGTVTVAFHAEDVHDFAWVCDDDFVVHEVEFPGDAGNASEERERMARILGRAPEALDPTPVRVRFLLQPEHAHQASRHERAVLHALELMGLWFGRYPYETLTVVDPDHRAPGAGGMEYPTLITGGTRWIAPRDGWSPEFVLVHEFAHQHFYGLVGTNEFEDAWMDEGLTTWATARVMARIKPPAPSHAWYAGIPLVGERPLPFEGFVHALPAALPPLRDLLQGAHVPFGSLPPVDAVARRMGAQAPARVAPWPSLPRDGPLDFLREVPLLTLLRPAPVSVREAERTRHAAHDLVDPIVGTFAWHHMDRGSYANNSYRRTSNALRTLEALVGEETVLRGIRTYAERHRFGHPRPEDLFEALREAAPEDRRAEVAYFLDEAFRSTGALDFAVEAIDVRPIGAKSGTGPDDEERKGEGSDDEGHEGERPDAPVPGAAPEPPTWESEVLVRRHGAMRHPVEILVRLDDGSSRRLRWGTDDLLVALDGQDVPPRTRPALEEQGRWVGLRIRGPHRVISAQVDPERTLDLDVDRTNDGRRTDARPVGLALALRLLGWVEMQTSFYGGL